METTHGLTYSVAKAIGVTVWKSVDSICHCCLTRVSCVEVTEPIFSGYSDGASACQKRWLECFRLSMPSPCDLQCVLYQPVCSMLKLGLTHSSCVVHMCTFCVILCGLRFSYILMTVMCVQLLNVLHVNSLRLAPQFCAFI